MKSRGFTLVELVVVIILTGILASSLVVFFKPVVDSFFDTQRRATLTDMADTALRRIGRDVRSAVPNSIRWPNNQCIELVPTSTGGRYRLASDTVNSGSAPLDITQPVTQFDVLSSMSVTPVIGDWVVIDNQSTNDVYTGTNRAAITAVTTPDSKLGQARISISSTQFPSGYFGGRFVVVPDNGGNPSIVYVCSGADGTVDAQGNGKGTLYRVTQALSATYPVACPTVTANASILATQVKSCNFVYNASQDGTQQNALVWLQLEISQKNEAIALAFGVHVDNVP